jgi:putative intracellular protease/amidase
MGRKTMRILFLIFPGDAETSMLRLGLLAPAYYLFRDLPADVVLASPLGGSPMATAAGQETEGQDVQRFLNDRMAREELADTLMVDQVVIDDFDAAYCLGLVGAIWKQTGAELVVSQFLEAGKPVVMIPGAGIDVSPRGAANGLLIIGDSEASPLLAARALIELLQQEPDERMPS